MKSVSNNLLHIINDLMKEETEKIEEFSRKQVSKKGKGMRFLF